MQKIKLSIALATFNEESNIGACLESIKSIADEIIIVDGSSSDKTREIAGAFGARVFKVSNKPMFHQNKQLALEKATGDWILQMDADERVILSLRDEILSTINNPVSAKASAGRQQSIINGYYIPRKNYFLRHWLKKGGQYPDYVIRLVKNGKAYFPCETVHEQIKVEGETAYLKNPLIHLSNPDLKSYFKKADLYTSETALGFKKNKVNKNILTFINFIFLKSTYTFFNLFLRHIGFVDGVYGFLFAFFSGLHYPIAYIKYYKE